MKGRINHLMLNVNRYDEAKLLLRLAAAESRLSKPDGLC
jgi:hypothetical protein